MNHIQRHLTPEEWERYDEIIAPMKALTEGFHPNEVCAKPFISRQLVTPSVVIMGYNPGKTGCNSIVWEDPHDHKSYDWANAQLRNPDDKFLKLFRRCFTKEDWSELVQADPIDLVWTNLYPFHTADLSRLNRLLDDIRKKDRHPGAVCRETIARLIIEIIHPRIVLCAGKDVARELYLGFKKTGNQQNQMTPLRELTKGVTYCQIGDIHLIGFSRITSIGFWHDHRNHNRNQEECLQSLTHKILSCEES